MMEGRVMVVGVGGRRPDRGTGNEVGKAPKIPAARHPATPAKVGSSRKKGPVVRLMWVFGSRELSRSASVAKENLRKKLA
jgi:hypothetical protein